MLEQMRAVIYYCCRRTYIPLRSMLKDFIVENASINGKGAGCVLILVVRWLLAFAGVCFSFCEPIYAGEHPIDPAEQLEREARQKSVQEELARIPERVRIPKDKGMRFKPFKGCLLIKNIKITGNNLLRNLLHSKEKEYLSSCLSHCVDSAKLNDLIIKLNTILFDKGYITARIEIENYSKKTNELTLQIQEGRIESIEANSINYHTVFPGLIGKELKAQDLEQGLEQLNRLPSRASIVTLWPGKEIGGTIVKVDTKKIGKPYRLYLMFDNTGNKRTGQDVLKGSFSVDDLFHLNDQFFLSGLKSGLGRDHSVAFTWKEEVPLGYYTMGYSGSYSDSQYDIYPGIKESELATNSLKNKLNISRIVYRSLNNHISLSTSFWHYAPHREIAGRPSFDDKKLSVFELSVRHDYYRPVFRVLTELNYAQGTQLLGATKDSSSLGLGAAHSQFRRYSLISDYLWSVSDKIRLNGNLQLQYAEQGLPGVAKLPVLDEIGGIRGLKSDGLTYDDGIILRHDIVFPLFFSSIAQNKIMREVVISPFLHGDIGWAKDKGTSEKLEQVSAVGGGIKLNLLGFNGQITVSKLIDKPSEIKGNGWVCLFELSQKLL